MRQADQYKCSGEKIILDDNKGYCICQDGSKCEFSDEGPISGCPCAVKEGTVIPPRNLCLI